MAELTRRYLVMTMATDAPFDPIDPEGVFVLKPWKDPAALRALATYRDNCYPELARDLDAWIRSIEAGPPVRGGDVGRRNEPYVTVTLTVEGERPARSGQKRPAAHARTTTRATHRSAAGGEGKASARSASSKRKKRGR